MRPWLVYALLALGAAALSGFTILTGVNAHDEGLMLQAASRVLDGQLPYEDFWWNYGPGQPYLLAGVEWAAGPSLLWWRVLRIATDALVSVLAYALARRQGAGRPEALGAWLACAAILAQPALPGRIPSPNATVLALGLGGALLARRSPVAGGALGGAALFFRFDLGLGAALAPVLAASGRTERTAGGPRRARHRRRPAGARSSCSAAPSAGGTRRSASRSPIRTSSGCRCRRSPG